MRTNKEQRPIFPLKEILDSGRSAIPRMRDRYDKGGGNDRILETAVFNILSFISLSLFYAQNFRLTTSRTVPLLETLKISCYNERAFVCICKIHSSYAKPSTFICSKVSYNLRINEIRYGVNDRNTE